VSGVPSLTRAAARERATSIHVDGYEIDLDLTRGDEVFGSRATITFTAAGDRRSTFAEVRPAVLRSVTLNGVPLDPATAQDGRLALPDLAVHNVLVVDAEMAYTNTGQGMHRFIDPVDDRPYVYAANFLDQAPTVFACFDQPDLKAPFTVRVRTDPTWIVAGNGAATETEPGQWSLAATPPLATYFVTVIAGPYHSVTAEHDGIPLAVYARTSLATALNTQAAELLAITRACLDRYHELFGVRYPFGAYHQAFLPEFTMGAMENPGCVTLRDDYIFTSAVTDAEREERALVLAHEMAHMWFGDLVTMTWWDDLWLNESFAEYLGHRVVAEVTEFASTWTTFALGTKAWGYAADQRPSTHPVSADVADTDAALLNFDGISYAKGAAVLRQLVALLGDGVFFAALREHFDAHAYGNASLGDLLAVLGDASGRDMSDWAHRWLRTAGVSTLQLTAAYDDHGRYADVHVTQRSGHAMRPHRIRIGAYVAGPSGTTTRREAVDVTVDPSLDSGSTDVAGLVGRPSAALLLPNDDDLTYAKIRLDQADVKRLPDVLASIDDPLARALLWGTAWDMTRDAERDAGWFVDLCAAALPAETEVGIFAQVMTYAQEFAVSRYLPPDRAAAARDTVARVARTVFDSAAGHAGRRLAAARALIAGADQRDVDWLRGWLDPEQDGAGLPAPSDLTVDAELRWLIIGRLAALGAAGEAEIAVEYGRDRTAIAGQHAARSRAARPDPAAKAAAWAALIDDTTMANRTLFAIAHGFFRPGQDAVTTPYVDRYVADMPLMASRRPAQVAERIARLAFPSYTVDAGTVAAMTRMRDDESLVPALRRALIDETDDLARSLAARDASAQLRPAGGERTHE
jgi:aminopeptidase N